MGDIAAASASPAVRAVLSRRALLVCAGACWLGRVCPRRSSKCASLEVAGAATSQSQLLLHVEQPPRGRAGADGGCSISRQQRGWVSCACRRCYAPRCVVCLVLVCVCLACAQASRL